MEFADKGDLYQKICEFKKAGVYFDESDIWRIFTQLIKGLKSLHELKILHRDLKVNIVELKTNFRVQMYFFSMMAVPSLGI